MADDVTSPESHLFLLWRWPASRTGELLELIGKRFTIRVVTRLVWSAEHFDANIRRFYAKSAEQAQDKRKEFGDEPFLLIVVDDEAPCYRYRIDGSGGYKKVNINTFDLKSELRKEGISLHVTDTLKEARRDIMLLTGRTMDDLLRDAVTWDGEIGELRSDVVGASGWKKLSQLFAVLNEAINYVVLRNFENLPDNHVVEEHGDVDLLVESLEGYLRAGAILNGNEGPWAEIGGQKIWFDLWQVESFYYDPSWSRKILSGRVLTRGFYAPGPEDYFFSLLYHAHIHRRTVPRDYGPRLAALARQIGLLNIVEEDLVDPEKAVELIGRYMRGQQFYLTWPENCPAYNEALASRVDGVRMMFQGSFQFLNEIGSAAREKAKADLEERSQSRIVALQAELDVLRSQANWFKTRSQSRRWLFRSLIRKVLDYPGDLRRRILG